MYHQYSKIILKTFKNYLKHHHQKRLENEAYDKKNFPTIL